MSEHPGYVVTAPLLFAKDQAGRLQQLRHDAWVPWLNDEQRAHFLRHGLVKEAPQPSVVQPADQSAPAPQLNPSDRPLKTAPIEAWVEYGVGCGHNRDELLALKKPELVELLG